MNRRLFTICVVGSLAIAGQASAQSGVQFFGFGVTCHKSYVGAPGAAFPTAGAAFPAPAFAVPTFAFPAAAYTFANPTPPANNAFPQPAAGQPAGNNDLVNAINELTKAVNALTAKLPGQSVVPTVPLQPKDKGASKFPVLSATPQRKEIDALVAEADRLRNERTKSDTGLVAR